MKLRKRPSEPTPPPAEGWGVRTTTATQRSRYYADSYYDSVQSKAAEKVPNMIAVRLTYNGKDHLTYGTVAVTATDFESKITSLQAAAEDRACALNAVGASA